MQEELAAAVTDVVAEGGCDLILNVDSAPYFAPVLDITARVTAKLNEGALSGAAGEEQLSTKRLSGSVRWHIIKAIHLAKSLNCWA